MYAIGIDIGTTSICGLLMDSKTGEIIHTVTSGNDAFIKSDKPWEKIQQADKIIEKAKEITDNLLNKANVETIGISCQMHGIVYTDSNANAVSPLYIWQDERGNQSYKDGKSYAAYLNSFAGYGLVTDFYNRENGLVPNTAVSCCTIGDLFGMKLCGKTAPVMHISNAASFGCFDIKSNKFTIDNGILPEITDSFQVVGEYKGAKVTVAIGDNQASFIGSVCGNMPLVNVGTGSQISYLCDSIIESENIEARPYNGNQYLIVGSSLCGGRAFALLERFFASVISMATGKECDSLYSMIDNMLLNKTQTDMVADSRFCGTRANPSIRAAFNNISQENFTAGDMAVSLIYAIAKELHGIYSGPACSSIVCSGNGIRKNPALQNAVSNVFASEIRIPNCKEEASFGAALTALTAVGDFSSLNEAQKLIKYR